ncbi:unnamed protein product [Psylliodes chrysocephalus]|uniref:Uncharacterized protein n=1 Tax=Psylliodes chrysocephalus TaxID=3402493 RepID=A0A9P0CWU6_9CUCU|nr:unnamed protein product [Psylliodes chrysocephala]
MRLPLFHTAKAANLTGISNRSAAKKATAVLTDMKIVSNKKIAQVVDNNKIRRAIFKNRNYLKNKWHNDNKNKDLDAIYFDGRKDQTIVDLNGHRIKKLEEHISLIQEPGSRYFGHISFTTSSKATDIASGISSFLNQNEVDMTNIKVIGCDGTNCNTGWKGGIIRLVETQLGKPLQWAVCYLHANEFPLRHLLQKQDGHTKGPYQYSGEIGSLLENCEKRPIVSFSKIETDLPDTNYKDLSTDQQYLYRICQAVSDDICPADLAQTNPGKTSHSRWLTTANRVLRLYVSVSEPSNNLKLPAKFIVKVYSTMWFVTKAKPYLQFGARHLWQTIYLLRQFAETITAVVDKAILNNAFYAHPKNILVAMLADERKHIRELAVRRILKARNKPEGVRVFRIPNLNFEAQDYIDLIKWAECTITEPP